MLRRADIEAVLGRYTVRMLIRSGWLVPASPEDLLKNRLALFAIELHPQFLTTLSPYSGHPRANAVCLEARVHFQWEPAASYSYHQATTYDGSRPTSASPAGRSFRPFPQPRSVHSTPVSSPR